MDKQDWLKEIRGYCLGSTLTQDEKDFFARVKDDELLVDYDEGFSPWESFVSYFELDEE